MRRAFPVCEEEEDKAEFPRKRERRHASFVVVRTNSTSMLLKRFPSSLAPLALSRFKNSRLRPSRAARCRHGGRG